MTQPYKPSAQSDQTKTNGQLLEQKNIIESEQIKKLKGMLKNAYQMQQTAVNTNVELNSQTEKLNRIKGLNESTGDVLKQADHTSKKMTSWRYYLWDKVKRLVVSDKPSAVNSEIIQPSQNQGSGSGDSPFNKNGYTEGKVCSEKIEKSEDEVDACLDELCERVKVVKGHAANTNLTLDKHAQIIDSIDKKMDKNSDKMAAINKRLNKKFGVGK